ncbi:MAG: hypothetical protein HY606_12550 [Planctomycetes bacterium]|nr:hypothetical protein [Planctomycetota bacterium]
MEKNSDRMRVLMPNVRSECLESFGKNDLKAETDLTRNCPIKGCTSKLSKVSYRKKDLPYCGVHGLRLHAKSSTFVYYNGDDKESSKLARLRNFQFHKDYIKQYVLNNPTKAETHRLGHENSEDALSWNVFVPFLDAELLPQLVTWLTGKEFTDPPELYMWGEQVDLNNSASIKGVYKPLEEARNHFEEDIERFKTEPDIMLIIPNKLVMCIEAKFTSGNPLAKEGYKKKEGEKPYDKTGVINRYLIENKWQFSKVIDVEKIKASEKFHTQIFRNIVFACWMAEKMNANWRVVNLVSSTQWEGKEVNKYDFSDPTPVIHDYLNEDYSNCFTFRTWEDLYNDLVNKNSSLEKLGNFMRQKTANLKPAFELNA